MKRPPLPRYAVVSTPVDYLAPSDPEVVAVVTSRKEAEDVKRDHGKRTVIYDLRTGRLAR